MGYNLCDDLKLALGNEFRENIKDFSALERYIASRLPMLVYRDESIQHYGTSHSIFYLKDKEDKKVYQGVWDLDNGVLTIGPVNSFINDAEGSLIKISCCANQVSFVERKDGYIIIEDMKEENGISVDTKIYSDDLWKYTCLEHLQFISSCGNIIPDYEFRLRKDNFNSTFDTSINNGEIIRDFDICTVSKNNAEVISAYFEKVDKYMNKVIPYQKKKDY